MSTRLVNWFSTKEAESGQTRVRYVRARVEKRPAWLAVSWFKSDVGPAQTLVRIRMQHWEKGPLPLVATLDSVTVATHTFSRTMFQLNNPRQSTVLAAAADLNDGQRMLLQFVVAGGGGVGECSDQLFSEAIGKALEMAADGPGVGS